MAKNIVLLSEIPTTYDKDEKRQVNAGNLLLRGVPGVGKTFFGVILAAISDAKFARLQGRADLQPTEVVGFQMINPSTGELVTEFGPMASAEVISVRSTMIDLRMSRSIAFNSFRSFSSQNETATPDAPARPVRPMRCT